MSQGGFDEVLSLGAGNQHIGRHPELAAVKFLASRDVLGRCALDPLVQVASVMDPPDFDQIVIAMRVQPLPVMPRSMHQQDFRG